MSQPLLFCTKPATSPIDGCQQNIPALALCNLKLKPMKYAARAQCVLKDPFKKYCSGCSLSGIFTEEKSFFCGGCSVFFSNEGELIRKSISKNLTSYVLLYVPHIADELVDHRSV